MDRRKFVAGAAAAVAASVAPSPVMPPVQSFREMILGRWVPVPGSLASLNARHKEFWTARYAEHAASLSRPPLDETRLASGNDEVLYVQHGLPGVGMFAAIYDPQNTNSMDALEKNGQPPRTILSISRAHPFDLSLAPDIMDNR